MAVLILVHLKVASRCKLALSGKKIKGKSLTIQMDVISNIAKCGGVKIDRKSIIRRLNGSNICHIVSENC